MKTSKDGVEFIKRHEGFRATPYRDIAGVMTIGYGHAILPNEVFGALSGLEATAILCRDLAIAENGVNTLVSVPINQEQFDALVDFTYNLGVGALQKSTLLQKINDGSPIGAISMEINRWVNAAGVPARGLITRRADEVRLYRTGDYGVPTLPVIPPKQAPIQVSVPPVEVSFFESFFSTLKNLAASFKGKE